MKGPLLNLVKMISKNFMLGLLLQCILFSTLVAGKANAQKINIREVYIDFSKMELSLFGLLNEIEEKTEFSFVYPDDYLNKDQVIKIGRRKRSVSEALYYVSKETNLKFKQINEAIYIGKGPQFNKNVEIVSEGTMQTITISGKVTSDEDGSALPGVNVLIQGTTVGTVTDVEGSYTIQVPDENSTLVFSFIGYVTEEVPVQGRSVIDMALVTDIQSLKEVVVIGYGSVQKSDLTGAVSSISSEDLGDRQATSVASLIQGRAPGVDVSGGKIRIRGITTFNNTDPLIVIDGFLGGDLATVNPNDIENIEVLKDASSTAIYGSRGANGVILVTTKSGKQGAPLDVNVNFWSGLKSTTKRRDVLNANQYIDYVHDALTNAGQSIPDKLLTDAVRMDVTNWQDEIFKTGNTSEFNVNFSGGSDKATYYLGLSHRSDEDIVIGPSSSATYLRAKNTFAIKPWLDFGANVALGYKVDKGVRPGIRFGYMPYKEIYDENQIGGYSDVDRINDASDWGNPLTAPNKIHPETNALAYQGQLNVIIKPFEGFSYTIQAGLKGDFQRFNRWTDEYINASNHVVNSMAESSSYSYSPIVENYINYSKKLGDHNISGLVGNTWQSGVQEGGIGISASGFATNEIKVNGVATNPQTPTQNIFIDSRLSYFGRLNYDYKSKYLLTVNFRADASPNFSPSNRWAKFPALAVAWKVDEESFLKDNNIINQLKLRAGWGRSGNDAIGQYRYLSSVFSQGSAYPLGLSQEFASGATVVQQATPNIKWETTESLTFGVDYALFNNSLTGTVEYFEKKTSDILFAVPNPLSLGYGTGGSATGGGENINGDPIVNAASVSNKGFEFLITKRGDLGKVNYNLSANYTYTENKVTSLGVGQPFLSGVSRTEKGSPIGYFYGYKAEGVFMTQTEIEAANASAVSNGFDYFQESSTSAGDVKFKDINGDGRITADDRTNIGNPIPKQMFGLNLSLDYGQLDFSMFWQGAADLDLYSEGYKWNRAGVRIGNQETNVLDRWISESQPGNGIQPRALSGDAVGNTRPSSLQVQDASYFRLKLLSVGYSFSDELTSKFGLTNLRLYASGENLLTLTGYDGMDPEVGGENLVRGITNFNYPTAKTFVFGIQVGI